jgi:hypothetical protein
MSRSGITEGKGQDCDLETLILKIALHADLRVTVAPKMAPILTSEDVVRRIAAECAYVDDQGGVGIRLEPAAAIVRQYGEQFRRVPRRRQTQRPSKPPPLL